MFKKIISNLPFSPTLINELGFYARRLSKEEAVRKSGLILTIFALVVQSFIVLSPPESANAASSSDIIHGGINSKSQLLAAWDNNRQGFRDIMQYAGITRQNLESTRETEIHSRDGGRDAGWRSWGRVSRFSAQQGEATHVVNGVTLYSRPLANFDTGRNRTGTGSWSRVFMGTNSRGQQFAIIKSCGNLTMKEDPPKPKNITVCRLKDKAYPVTILESEFNAGLYSKNPEDCKEKPKPVATCSSLVVTKINRTSFKLTANASVANGATVSGYTFVVKDASGKEVVRKSVASSAMAVSHQVDLSGEGNYSVEVIVATSLGNITSDGCRSTITVSPIERCPVNPALPINDPSCQPCPAEPTLWVKDEDCSAKVIRSKSAKNLTENVAASETVAKSNNRIEYTLTMVNEGKANATFKIEDNLTDVLEYSELYDRGGGTFDDSTKILSWGEITLKPNETQKRTYVIQMRGEISSMARGQSDGSSYDCRMTNSFGTTVDIAVDCPAPKVVEQVVPSLPRTGPTENIIVGGTVLAVVAFLYFRSRQLNKEVRLIRREMTAGTI